MSVNMPNTKVIRKNKYSLRPQFNLCETFNKKINNDLVNNKQSQDSFYESKDCGRIFFGKSLGIKSTDEKSTNPFSEHNNRYYNDKYDYNYDCDELSGSYPDPDYSYPDPDYSYPDPDYSYPEPDNSNPEPDNSNLETDNSNLETDNSNLETDNSNYVSDKKVAKGWVVLSFNKRI